MTKVLADSLILGIHSIPMPRQVLFYDDKALLIDRSHHLLKHAQNDLLTKLSKLFRPFQADLFDHKHEMLPKY